MWKQWLFIFLSIFIGLGFAADTPQRKLFAFVSQVLTEEYVNPRQIDIALMLKQGQDKLEQICKNQTNCTFVNAQKVIKESLSLVGDAHLKFNIDKLDGSDLGDPGFKFGFYVRFDAKKCVVTYVYPESPAEKVGMKVGMQILAVDGQTQTPEALSRRLREKELSAFETNLSVIENAKERKLVIRASDERGYYPVNYLHKSGTQLIRVLEVDDYHDQVFHDIIKKIAVSSKALIIDLRNNAGGTSLSSMKMAAAFLDKPGRIMVQKDGVRWILEFDGKGISWRNADKPSEKGKFQGNLRQVSKFSGKVAVLVSNATFSAGEQLAHLLQSGGVARVFGEPTAGALDSSATSKHFEDGGDLIYGINRYQDLNGNWAPPRVTPDEIVPLDLDLLTQGRDTQLEAALNYLNSK